MLAVACGLLALGVVAFLISPLLDPQRRMIDGKPEMEDLLKKKDFLYAAIRELNIDYNMGKLSADDHHQLQNEYMKEASVVLDQLERSSNGKSHVDAQIEQAVLEIRKKRGLSLPDNGIPPSEPPVQTPPDIETATVDDAMDQDEKVCPQCDTANDPDANFCIECGSSLAVPACEACGESCKAGAKFCAHCGHKLGTDAPA